MALVNFKKGTLASLPSTYAEGTFYVTTDEPGLYLDISGSERVRFGDFQEFASLSALNANSNPSTTVLYYVKDINCLAKWDGSQYRQINRDTGVTSVEVVGTGNVITAVSYDEATRKLTLTKGLTAATPSDIDTKIADKVGEIDGTIKEYVDAKTDGIATEAALGELKTRMDTAEGKIEGLEEQVGEGTVSDQIDGKIEALKLSETYEPKGTGAVEAGKVQSALDSYKTDNDAAVAKVAEDLSKEVARATAAEATNAAAAADAKSAADAAQGEIDALEQVVGTPDSGKTIVQMIKDAQDAATYDDTKVKEDIAANAAAIAEAQGEIDANALAIAAVKEDVDAFFKDADMTASAKDTLKELQEYIASDETAASAMTASIKQNTDAIDAVEGRMDTTEGKVSTLEGEMDAVEGRLDVVEPKVSTLEGKVSTLESKAHEHSNKGELDKIASGDVAKWNAAEQNAKDYADDLDNAMNARVQVLEAIEHHSHSNKAELDLIVPGDKAKWDAAAAKAHEHSNKTVLDGITAAKVTAWDNAQANAVATANAHSDAIKTELVSADAANLQAAKDYSDGQLQAALTWGSF